MTTLAQARKAYQQAMASDDCADWKSAATTLWAYVNKPKASRKPAKRRPYRPGKGMKQQPVAVTTFADGVTARRAFWTQDGKPLDWQRAIAQAESAYRFDAASKARKTDGRINFWAYADRIKPPAIIAMIEENSGEQCPLIDPQDIAA